MSVTQSTPTTIKSPKYDNTDKPGNAKVVPNTISTNQMYFSKVIIFFSCGMVFGFALSKGRVFEPGNIFAQMVFEKFIMFKMFFMAMIGSLLSLSLLSIYFTDKFQVACQNYVKCSNKSVFVIALGGLLLGVGMSVSGSCPGNVYIQFGGGLKYAWVTLVGALAGAFVGSYLVPVISRNSHHIIENQLLHTRLQVPFSKLAMPFAFILFVAVCLLEYLVPWKTEVVKMNDSTSNNPLTFFAWNPMVSGLLVGLLQIPVVLLANDTIGGSSSFMTILANVLPTKISNDHLNQFESGLENFWQVLYVLGACFGSALSSTLSSSYGVADSIDNFGPVRAFIGGFLMLIGSRLAGGCTSGHGISGMGLLNLNSVIAVCFMFIGGIACAVTITLTM